METIQEIDGTVDVSELKWHVQKILDETFRSFPDEKRVIYEDQDSLQVACPLCGDSKDRHHRKRGNLYLDTGYYHCFNCGAHMSINSLFASFQMHLPYKTATSITILNKTARDSGHDTTDVATYLDIDSYAIPVSKIAIHFGLDKSEPTDDFIKTRLLANHVRKIYKRPKEVFLMNMYGEKVLGFQIKSLKSRYFEKWTLARMHTEILDNKVNTPDFVKINKYSLYYNIFNLNFAKPITIFESAIDSWLYANSACTSSVTADTTKLDDIDTVRYFQDDDQAGKKFAVEKLNKGKPVFMWTKLRNDYDIPESYQTKDGVKKVKDYNDILMYIQDKKDKWQLIKELPNYFTDSIFNQIHI